MGMWHCTCVTPVDVRAGNIDCVDSSSGEITACKVALSPEPAAGVTLGSVAQMAEHPVLTRTAGGSTPPGPTNSPSTAISSAAQRLKALEDDILERSMRTVEAALHWEDIDPDVTEPPAEWVESIGYEAAKKRLRVAKAAWMSAKEAPVALNMARTTALGITKVRSALKISSPTLQINLVSFASPMADIATIDVESE